MAFSYIRHDSLFLRQGEIISNLFEPQLQIPNSDTIDTKRGAKIVPIVHPYTIIVSQDCDLKWDYDARQGGVAEDKLLSHILFCALFTKDEIITRNKLKSDLFKRVRQNQDERYHHLDEALVGSTQDTLPELIADFKSIFSLQTELVYWFLSSNQATRQGALFSPYLEDFMHRLYNFLGRVATP